MLPRILSSPLWRTAVRNPFPNRDRLHSSLQRIHGFFSTGSRSSGQTPSDRFLRPDGVGSLVDGCDYQHWLVVMHAPDNYPQRDQIIQQYIETLAMVLGSEEAAKKSIYSVSTKYYYAFSCEIPQNMTHKIRSLPRVKWVLPDAYLSVDENGYGGEPLVNGNIVPYEERHHSHWLHDEHSNSSKETKVPKKCRRKRKGNFHSDN